jgi:hypothetical protein
MIQDSASFCNKLSDLPPVRVGDDDSQYINHAIRNRVG